MTDVWQTLPRVFTLVREVLCLGSLGMVLLVFAHGQTPTGRATGAIHGIVLTEQGTAVRGAAVLLKRVQASPGTTKALIPQMTVSDANGMYAFRGLPAGLYVGCARLAGSKLLNPCEWFDNPPAAILDDGAIVIDLKIVMKQGKLVNVYLDDPGKKLPSDANGNRSVGANVQVWSPRGAHVASGFGESSGGQNYLFAVPAGVSLQLDVSSPTVGFRGDGDADSYNLNGRGSVTGAAGTSPTVPQKFSIAIGDSDRNFRYSVQPKAGN